MAKLPSNNPLARRLRSAAKGPESRPAPKDPAGAIDRANRAQAMETKEMKMTKKPMKKYAKGGSIDGCASKGKTRAATVKMAAGGFGGAGTGKMPPPVRKGVAPAERKGGTGPMPPPGGVTKRMGINPQERGGPAMVGLRGFKRGGSCGMKKGK